MTSTDVRQRAEAKVGQTLRGKWRLDRLIGVGGMASVYAATHRNGKLGAVKILHPEMCLIEEAKSRFLREGYVANKVEHPGAVSVLDDDVAEDGTVFLVMELLVGESVDQKLAKCPGGRMSATMAVPIIIDLLDTLAAAHHHGVIHRDLKPENVFVTNQNQVKVLDFGIARLREATQSAAGTQTGSLLGTPNFMPPEQALGDWAKVDGRTDVWAATATLFSMIAGRPVHLGDSPQKILLSAMTNPAPPILTVAPDTDPYLAQVVDRGLAFERDHRWPSASDMRDALRAYTQAGFRAPGAFGAQSAQAHAHMAQPQAAPAQFANPQNPHASGQHALGQLQGRQSLPSIPYAQQQHPTPQPQQHAQQAALQQQQAPHQSANPSGGSWPTANPTPGSLGNAAAYRPMAQSHPSVPNAASLGGTGNPSGAHGPVAAVVAGGGTLHRAAVTNSADAPPNSSRKPATIILAIAAAIAVTISIVLVLLGPGKSSGAKPSGDAQHSDTASAAAIATAPSKGGNSTDKTEAGTTSEHAGADTTPTTPTPPTSGATASENPSAVESATTSSKPAGPGSHRPTITIKPPPPTAPPPATKPTSIFDGSRR